MAKGWLTPESAATGYIVVVLRVPDHPAGRAQLRGLLLDFTDPARYVNEYGISELDAAVEWEQALTDVLEWTTCDDI